MAYYPQGYHPPGYPVAYPPPPPPPPPPPTVIYHAPPVYHHPGHPPPPGAEAKKGCCDSCSGCIMGTLCSCCALAGIIAACLHHEGGAEAISGVAEAAVGVLGK